MVSYFINLIAEKNGERYVFKTFEADDRETAEEKFYGLCGSGEDAKLQEYLSAQKTDKNLTVLAELVKTEYESDDEFATYASLLEIHKWQPAAE